MPLLHNDHADFDTILLLFVYSVDDHDVYSLYTVDTYIIPR